MPELAIVLTIIGIVGGMSLPLLTQSLIKNKQEADRQQHERLMRCLASHVLRHGRLPYAANPNASGDSFGKEESDRIAGILPFKELELEESMVKDSENHYISYVVDKTFCQTRGNPDPPNPGLNRGGPPGGAQRPYSSSPFVSNPARGGEAGGSRYGQGEPVSGGQGGQARGQTGEAARSYCKRGFFSSTELTLDPPYGLNERKVVILISHGPGGYGAFKEGEGALLPDNGSGPEYDNSRALRHQGRLYKKFPYSTRQETRFRQWITSASRDGLLSFYTLFPCDDRT